MQYVVVQRISMQEKRLIAALPQPCVHVPHSNLPEFDHLIHGSKKQGGKCAVPGLRVPCLFFPGCRFLAKHCYPNSPGGETEA